MTTAESCVGEDPTAPEAVQPAETMATQQPPQAQAVPLKRLAMRGAAWTIAGYGASQVLRLGSSLILTRLLFPEVFGLMALVNIFMHGLQMFSDVGLRPAVIRDRRGDDPAFVNTAWTIQIIRGLVLWGCSCLLALPLARLFGEPMLTWLVPVAGITALIGGFNATSLLTAMRHLRLAQVNLLELGSQAIAIVVMVVWALWSPSVWALVGGGLVGALVRMIGSHLLIPGIRVRLCWEKEAIRGLLSFGKWIFLSSAVHFLASQGDRLLLGKLVSMGTLGVYSLAFNLAMMLQLLSSRLSGQVLYPALSQIGRAQPERLPDAYYSARRHLDILLVGAGVMMTGGSAIISVLYDERYAAAGWMLQLLGIRTAMACLNCPAESYLVSRGYPSYCLMRRVATMSWMLAGLPLGWYLAGLQGVVLAAATAEAPTLAVFWYGLSRRGVLRPRRELRVIGYLLVGLLAGLIPTALGV